MHIYIDESGVFSNPQGRSNVPSCLGALIIPSERKKALFRDFEWIKKGWGFARQEIKGSRLDEYQVEQVVTVLRKYDVLFEVSAIDMEFHPNYAMEEFKKQSVAGITQSLTPKHEPAVVNAAYDIADSINAMSYPLFVQALIMQYLIPRTWEHGMHYYARRLPKELARFYWTIDAKDNTRVDYERAWSQLIFTTMFTSSLERPMSLIEGGDYSGLDRFYKPIEIDESLLVEFGYNRSDLESISLKEILTEHLKFQDSRENLGLQLVDILTTSTRRALKGTLSRSGWLNIGSLMLRKNVNGKPLAIEPVRLNLWNKRGDTSFTVETAKEVYATYLSKTKSLLRSDERFDIG